jgi:acetolactate synthase small subunit
MTPDERIDQLEKRLATAVERIAVLEYQLVQYDMVERMAFMSYSRTHPEARRDIVRIDDIINHNILHHDDPPL